MAAKVIHQCQCEKCQGQDLQPERALHYQMNLLLSRLDEAPQLVCSPITRPQKAAAK